MELASFWLNAACCFAKKHMWHISKCHLVTAEPPFTTKIINCMHQTGPRKGAYRPTVCYPCTWCVSSLSLCEKWELFLSSIEVKANGQYCWDMLLSQQLLDAIKRVVDDKFLFQQALHRCVLHSHSPVTAVQKNFLSSKLWPHKSPELKVH